MAQSPQSSGSNSSKGGGSSSKTNTGGSRSSSKSSSRGKAKSSNKRGSMELLANVVPSHHAHHGMAGEYSTKGKFANMPDGSIAFGE